MNMYQIVLTDRKYRRQSMKKLAAAIRVLMQNPNDAIIKIETEEKENCTYYTATIEQRNGG